MLLGGSAVATGMDGWMAATLKNHVPPTAARKHRAIKPVNTSFSFMMFSPLGRSLFHVRLEWSLSLPWWLRFVAGQQQFPEFFIPHFGSLFPLGLPL